MATAVRTKPGYGRGGDVEPGDAIQAIHEVMGVHPGLRAAHARGTLCTGVFTPTERAGRLTKAPHMRKWSDDPAEDQVVPVLVRFSNGSGDPALPDGARDARGMATRFHPKGRKTTDIVAVTLPCFFAPDPGAFKEFNQAFRRRGAGKAPQPRPIKLLRYYLGHAAARRGITAALRGTRVPSYANCRYNALHAFKWTDKPGSERFVRYSWIPGEGERKMSWLAARKQTADYLQRDLYDRLGREPVRPLRFTLELQIATFREVDEQLICDPTSVWPDHCERVTAGVLEVMALEDVASVAEQARHEGQKILEEQFKSVAGDEARKPQPAIEPFNPLSLPDGIAPPSLPGDETCSCCDPVLAFRPDTYMVSYDERTGRTPEYR